MVSRVIFRALFAVVCLSLGSFSFGQSDLPPELAASYATINQKSVMATVCFLASDEMAGRDTPSHELDIAAAYVAARFRAAGLQGGGDGGSFYQTTEIATVQLPTSGLSIQQNGKPVQHFGLLAGDAEPVSYSGEVQFISAADEFRDATFKGPVYYEPGDLEEPRAVGNLMRQASVLKRNGATAILIPVEPGSELIATAQRLSQPLMLRSRGGSSGPILLVSKLQPGGKFDIELPKQTGGKAKVQNVIGVLPGSDPALKNEAIIFSAHLDHIGQKSGSGDTIYNGADDDATGVTGVLTLADAYAAMPIAPKRTVIFITFWGEEKGLLGSKFYVNNPTWPLGKVVANINIEMIGRPEAGGNEKCWVTGWNYSTLGESMAAGAKSVGILIFEHPQFGGNMLYRASDNAPFVDKGVIAHSFSAGSLHSDYHQVSDEWEKLELRHMTRVIQGLFAGSLPIANGDVTPQKTGGR